MGAVRTRYLAPTIPICTLHWTLTYLGTSMYIGPHTCMSGYVSAIPWRGQTLHITAYDTMSRVTTSPILAYPDYSKRFILYTDASNYGIGAVLSQISDDGSECVIAYASRSLSRQEQRYCVTRRELLAIVEFVQHFRQYLLGRQFTLRTDHGSLVWVRNFKEPEGQLARWLERLELHSDPQTRLSTLQCRCPFPRSLYMSRPRTNMT